MAEKIEHNEEVIPEQVTIGEQTFVLKDTPELQALILSTTKSAQKIEKDKLYATIEGFKKQISELTEKVNKVPAPVATVPKPPDLNQPDAEKNKEYKELIAKFNKEGGSITMENVAELIDLKFQTVLPETLRTILDPVTKQITQARDLQIKGYRDTRLAQLGDTVIPELVKGSTEEEIEASIPNAFEIRKRYQVGVPAVPIPVPVVGSAPLPIPAVPLPIPRIPLGDENPVDIKNMSDEDFAKNRTGLLKGIKTHVSEYPVMGNQ